MRSCKNMVFPPGKPCFFFFTLDFYAPALYVIHQKAGLSRNNFLYGSIFGLIVHRVAAEHYACFLFFLCTERSRFAGARLAVVAALVTYSSTLPSRTPRQNTPGCAISLLIYGGLFYACRRACQPGRRKVVCIDSAAGAAYGSRPNHTALQAALFANSQAALLQLPAKIILHTNSPV